MRFSSSPLTAYPLLTVQKWRRKNFFLNVPFIACDERTLSEHNPYLSRQDGTGHYQKLLINIYLAFWKTVQFAQ